MKHGMHLYLSLSTRTMMHLLATIDIPEKRGTQMVKDESGSEGTIVPLRMINLVKHEKKLSSALPIKPNL